ncbi:hypothetical protein Taro_047951, partial [Colocasia esculenta]|nr:hypothetical protein [Colocasia esculenta]
MINELHIMNIKALLLLLKNKIVQVMTDLRTPITNMTTQTSLLFLST